MTKPETDGDTSALPLSEHPEIQRGKVVETEKDEDGIFVATAVRIHGGYILEGAIVDDLLEQFGIVDKM